MAGNQVALDQVSDSGTYHSLESHGPIQVTCVGPISNRYGRVAILPIAVITAFLAWLCRLITWLCDVRIPSSLPSFVSSSHWVLANNSQAYPRLGWVLLKLLVTLTVSIVLAACVCYLASVENSTSFSDELKKLLFSHNESALPTKIINTSISLVEQGFNPFATEKRSRI